MASIFQRPAHRRRVSRATRSFAPGEIFDRRRALHMTQKDLAKKAAISVGTAWKAERGIAIDLHSYSAIERALEIRHQFSLVHTPMFLADRQQFVETASQAAFSIQCDTNGARRVAIGSLPARRAEFSSNPIFDPIGMGQSQSFATS